MTIAIPLIKGFVALAHLAAPISARYAFYVGKDLPLMAAWFPPPSTNGGINEKGVEVRDIWASNDDELVKMTPTPQHGVQYSNLARLVMERASTAREGVELFGNLIKERGYATYGGNSHLIADCNKGGPITRPATAGLSTSPKRSWRIQLSLWSLLANKIQSSVFADDQASYGQVLSLKQGVHPDLLRIWIAPTASVAAPHVPYWLRVNSILPEFGQHRYLYDGASSTFLNPDFMLQQASQFAGRLFKRVLYYMCSNPKGFLPIDRYVDGIRGVVTERHWLGRTE
ncbi:hypothetical protein BDFG_00310 [Blastomyces dermatitidis ATCC 26199]|nr:hypothetical protein BDFG_00310 [Blastomyces dermatitidis ATCC 26199]